MPPRTSLAPMTPLKSSKSRINPDNEGLMDNASKRQRLHGTTYTETCATNELLHEDYTIGWICALPKEMAAAIAMLDGTHKAMPRAENDSNTYALGSIAAHNVVIACLPSGYYGNNNAATVTSNMRRTFPSIRLCLMVGIGGGAPGKADIRLGDVVVGEGVLQHDMGKTVGQGSITRTGHLIRPPRELLTAVAKLRADHEVGFSQIPSHLSEMLKRHPTMSLYAYRASLQDHLFDSTYEHVESTAISTDHCELCNTSRLVKRPPRHYQNAKIHYGIIASGNQVVKHGKARDELAYKLNALCVEMEGAGVMDGFAGLVVRGICDYSDSHKNKQWQEVAAAAAAAYAKELLLAIPVDGDTVVPIVALPPVNIDRQKRLSNSLKFDRIDARRSNIKAKYSTTCQWLLTHPDYVDWLDPNKADQHHGFLWIRGSPGTGKSTIMNFLCKEMMNDKERKVISFFFNARGGALEQSILGMYRSLLYQILDTLPSLAQVLNEPEHKNYLNDLDTAILKHQRSVWRVDVLQNLLRSALVKLGPTALTIFVDALDECASDQVEDLIEHFEDVEEQALLSGSQLSICFSSRFYPHIDVQYGRKIDLDAQEGHKKDIAMYIQNKLKIGRGNTAEEVRTEIQTKAKGIFIWVLLVVNILNTEYKDGRIFDVKRRLASLPAKLNDLFKGILSRDQKNLRDLRLCVQWILFSKRPLKLEEYYFAAVSGLNPDELREWDPDDVTLDDMNRFVISSSKGLAETTKSEIKIVQFIHESVREFFLGDGRHELWPSLATAEFESASHAQLQQCCYSYLPADTLGLPLPEPWTDDAKRLRAYVSGKFPFLEYALLYVLSHADAAAHSISQRDFLDRFTLDAWIYLENLFGAYKYDHYTPNASLVYILAEMNLARLVKDALCLASNAPIEGERHQNPLFPAAEKGHEGVVRVLLEAGSDVAARDECSNTPLLLAARNGHSAIVKLLLDKDSDVEAKDVSLSSPLLYATENGHDAVARLLLEKGANVDVEDYRHYTPLMLAARCGDEYLVRLCLERGVTPDTKTAMNQTPLLMAARFGDDVIARLLLDKGAAVDTKNERKHTPLMIAAACGGEATVRLLLERGANIEAENCENWTPLLHAASKGQRNVVRLLLENGANVEAHSNLGWTPLLLAVEGKLAGDKYVKWRCAATVQLLLEYGANVKARTFHGLTAFSLARANRDEAILQLLESYL